MTQRSVNIVARFPQESEQALIGAACRGFRCLPALAQRVGRHDFYAVRHQDIWERVERILATGMIPDLVSISAELRRDGKLAEIGGDAYLMDLSDSVVSEAGMDACAKIVHDESVVRLIQRQAYEMLNKTADESAADLLDIASKHSSTLTQAALPGGSSTGEMLSVTEGILSQDAPPRRILTGYKFLDSQLKIRPGNQVVIAATTGVGKSSLALGIAMFVARTEGPVLFSNLEMSIQEMTESVMSSATGIPLDNIADHLLTEEEVVRCRRAAAMFNILFIPCYRLAALRAQARAMKANGGLGAIFVDYLQLMEGIGDNKNEQVGGISRGLKQLAAELDVPVFLLSQLNREAVKDGRPKLHHLRDSGSIEQDANTVIMLSRNQDVFPDVLVAVEKARRGGTFDARAGFVGKLARFHDLEDDPYGSRYC